MTFVLTAGALTRMVIVSFSKKVNSQGHCVPFEED